VDADPCGRIGRAIQESGTPLLDNRVLEVRGHNVRLHVGGVDDVWMGRPNLDAVLARLPDAGNSAAILLAHEPDFAEVPSRTGRFDLQLSGHSHGGQVRLPFVGAPKLPPRVRFLCRPEITAFSLYPR